MTVVEENLNKKLTEMIDQKSAIVNEIKEKEKVA